MLTGAVELRATAIVEFSGDETVGDYLGVSYEDPNAATHRFLAHVPGYQGWQWAVVVAGYPGADHATISEVVLVPGPTALLAPEWVPWEQRVRAGDLSPGDLLAPAEDDPRLVPGYTATGDPQVDEVAAEIGLGRRWVMSAWGRAEAAERWHDGDYGPDSRWRGRPAGVPRLRIFPAAGRIARRDVRGLRQRDVRRRARRRLRIRLRRPLGHPGSGGHRFADIRAVRRRRPRRDQSRRPASRAAELPSPKPRPPSCSRRRP